MSRSPLAAVVCATALALAGCTIDDNNAHAAEQFTENGIPGSTPTGDGTDGITPMEAGDGWAGVHDLPLPDPGTATVSINGIDLVFSVTCDGPGEVLPSDVDAHGGRVFWFHFQGETALDNGRLVRLSGSRAVASFEEWSAVGNDSAYPYQGQDSAYIELTVFDEDGMAHTSSRRSPSDADPTGEALPLVHVDPSGAFTVVTHIPSMARRIPGDHGYHAHAIEGDAVIAGRCQPEWPESDDR
jgi:hypothetical protein